MNAAIVRIFLRYFAMFLVTKGFFSPEDGAALSVDPDIAQFLEIGVGFAISAATEGWYYLARKFGWAK